MAECASRREPAAGFTLVEVLIALVLVLLVLFITADLWLEAGRTIAHASARALDERPDLAVERLRRDVRTARGLVAAPPLPSASDLVLVGRAGEQIAYSRVGTRLARRVTRPEEESEWQTLLDDVVGWSWQALPGGLVLVQLTVVRRTAPFLRSAGSTRVRPDRGRTETLTMVAGLRSGRRAAW